MAAALPLLRPLWSYARHVVSYPNTLRAPRAAFHASFVPTQNAQVRLEDPKLQITFTCTAPSCSGVRSTHEFSKQAYEKGIVLVQCPGCKTRHLIADHLGWFEGADLTGKGRTIEEIMASQGEAVKRGTLSTDDDAEEGQTVSFSPESDR